MGESVGRVKIVLGTVINSVNRMINQPYGMIYLKRNRTDRLTMPKPSRADTVRRDQGYHGFGTK